MRKVTLHRSGQAGWLDPELDVGQSFVGGARRGVDLALGGADRNGGLGNSTAQLARPLFGAAELATQ